MRGFQRKNAEKKLVRVQLSTCSVTAPASTLAGDQQHAGWQRRSASVLRVGQWKLTQRNRGWSLCIILENVMHVFVRHVVSK